MHLPEVTVSSRPLFELLLAPIEMKLVLSGIELKVFNHVSEPTTADAVAKAIDSHPGNTGLLLDGLAAMDLLTKQNGRYQNTTTSQTFLVEGSPTYLGQLFTRQASFDAFAVDEVAKLVKEGPPAPSKTNTASDEMSVDDVISYINFERSGLAQTIARITSELPEFPSFQKMLDLGGGPGLNGIATVLAHPSMKGVIFDRPTTIEVAASSIKEYEVEDRVETLGGDYLNGPIGDGYDLILTSDTLYYDPADLDTITKKIHDALNPGGVFIALHPTVTDERTKPEILVPGAVLTAIGGDDMGLPDRGYIADSMIRSGFASVRSRVLDMAWAPLDLDIGRKR